jgi:hypothetical protein
LPGTQRVPPGIQRALLRIHVPVRARTGIEIVYPAFPDAIAVVGRKKKLKQEETESAEKSNAGPLLSLLSPVQNVLKVVDPAGANCGDESRPVGFVARRSLLNVVSTTPSEGRRNLNRRKQRAQRSQTPAPLLSLLPPVQKVLKVVDASAG